MTPPKNAGRKPARCESRPLSLSAAAFCIRDPSITGFVEREGARAIRDQQGPVELFVPDRETPRYALFRRRLFTTGSLALAAGEQASPG